MRHAIRQGYTLTELTTVLAIVSVLAGIATPPVVRLRDTIAVDQAARQIAAAHQRARITAILRGCAMVLTISADSITLRPHNDTIFVWREAGPAARGVTLTTPVRHINFSPIGLATGVGNATYTTIRGNARRSVIVSRLGRVRIAP